MSNINTPRDPRIDPKAGDVLGLPARFRPLEIAEVSRDTILVWGNDRGRRRKMALCSTCKWSEIAKEAKVIKYAD